MPPRTPLFADDLIAWYLDERRDLPWRADDATPWGVLVSEFMLQQTQVDRVLPRWHEWMLAWPTPCDLAAASAGDAIRAWDRLGYPRRAGWLHAAARQICADHAGIVPDDLDTLLSLKGVGDYTARAVLVFAFHQRHPVVDTNIRRVLARAADGEAEPGAPTPVHDLPAMSAQLPADAERARLATYAFMEFGALVCTARAPSCETCSIRSRCAWVAAGSPPSAVPKRRTQARFEGSDRQARGRIMAVLRAAREPVTVDDLLQDAPDRPQAERALASLVADGLAVESEHGGRFQLP
ncbi:A/G-specific adenine glycosylase [Pseudoclavibacter sp. 13-3]|uniref:A/G-specific adenine glycosylase n=1 Tax=Pseudoclavibacter sp. 13-3 TaxID=2901228 RepID=UPI001E440284|nr:A/G-specific adenine glycosylase [Pseudoclavibacter sp. 13-3]MCD7100898.1 A/G-specific adenine glycosylase [Pseudoclavibacter sp. 13-3]